MTFEQYVELRSLAFVIYVTNRGTVYDPITKLLRENNIDIFDFFYNIMKQIDSAPKVIREVFKRFKDATINELWDSPEEIIANYQKDSEYQKLLNGQAGINVCPPVKAQVIGFDDEDVFLTPLDALDQIGPKTPVINRAKQLDVGVGTELLGRVVNSLGEPIDGLSYSMRKRRCRLCSDRFRTRRSRSVRCRTN